MDRYVGNGYSTQQTGGFVTRFAQLCKEKEVNSQASDKEIFNQGYRKGNLRLATATRYMKLVNAGLDRYVEAENNVVWAKEGENIIRLESNLDWVDEFLAQEGNR